MATTARKLPLRPRTYIWDIPPDLIAQIDRLAKAKQSTRGRIASELIQYALTAFRLLERIKPRLDEEAALAAGMTYLGARLYVSQAMQQATVEQPQEVPAEETPA
jgi:hypothetical protein